MRRKREYSLCFKILNKGGFAFISNVKVGTIFRTSYYKRNILSFQIPYFYRRVLTRSVIYPTSKRYKKKSPFHGWAFSKEAKIEKFLVYNTGDISVGPCTRRRRKSSRHSLGWKFKWPHLVSKLQPFSRQMAAGVIISVTGFVRQIY